MSRIVRWDPFREVLSARNQMDRLVGDLLREPSGWQGDGARPFTRLALDVSEDDHSFSVTASLAGIDPEKIDISFSENTLTIRGETQAAGVEEDVKWHLRERRFGRFSRSLTLPAAVNADAISADYVDGVLTLSLPKAEGVKPRRIAVRGATAAELAA